MTSDEKSARDARTVSPRGRDSVPTPSAERSPEDEAALGPFAPGTTVGKKFRIDRVLGQAKSLADLGTCFGADLTEAEVHYLMTEEWAQDVDDILWRRSKLGLRFNAEQRAALATFMAGAAANAAE